MRTTKKTVRNEFIVLFVSIGLFTAFLLGQKIGKKSSYEAGYKAGANDALDVTIFTFESLHNINKPGYKLPTRAEVKVLREKLHKVKAVSNKHFSEWN